MMEPEAPIKTCEYCGATGKMPTFMSGETSCIQCISSFPQGHHALRHEVFDLRKLLAAAEARAEKAERDWYDYKADFDARFKAVCLERDRLKIEDIDKATG
jgi:hypothetical protein